MLSIRHASWSLAPTNANQAKEGIIFGYRLGSALRRLGLAAGVSTARSS